MQRQKIKSDNLLKTKCTLCKSENCEFLCKDKRRSFLYCNDCGLIFVPPYDHVNLSEEKLRYDKHNNTVNNKGYVKFLEKIVKTVEEHAEKVSAILDFGCGKSAVLVHLLEKRGYRCIGYDPLYKTGCEQVNSGFDIVILCEVIEHLRALDTELDFIRGLLKPRSKVIIRTQLYKTPDSICDWWYARDITHINFFSKKSIELVGLKIGLELVSVRNEDIFIFA